MAARGKKSVQSAEAEALVEEHTKDELVAAAKVEGVDVKSRDTKAEVAEKLAEATAEGKVQVSNFTRRSGNDALFGSFVDVVGGEHEGRRGHYFEDVSHGPDGYPDLVLVRSRDEHNEVLQAKYSDIRPTSYTGGR